MKACLLIVGIILITTTVAQDTIDKCMKPVHIYRERYQLQPWSFDQALQSKMMEKLNRHCLSQKEMDNFEGYHVYRLASSNDMFPGQLLVEGVKTITCVEIDCPEQHDVFYYFVKKD
ncbi:hypothetical protein B9Z55_017389 [Caenorhabditis nigoni]|uniref:SCP domain-containing protein n=1 Tax=Caenorhabditis nigoni TaxID=1611254 RepID=A0A2G5T9U0_9PELO|nr:hypothetical protein B9Z55_017389 [Caenorhabditis nigoni]